MGGNGFQRPEDSVTGLLADWSAKLATTGVPSPQHDARALAAHVLDVTPGELFLLSSLDSDDVLRIDELVQRRATREPLQHITGSVGFLGLDLQVGPGVFVPRPETELMADHVARYLRAESPDPSVAPEVAGRISVVDLGTGSGALGLAVAANVAGVACVGVETSATASNYARRNAAACCDQLAARQSSFAVVRADAISVASAELADMQGKVDVVVCNPPYIPDDAIPREPEARFYDPVEALYGGADGLDVARQFVGTAAKLLRPGGMLAMEHADSQGEGAGEAGVPGLLRNWIGADDEQDQSESVFQQVVDHFDLNERPRFTTAIRIGS